LSRLDSLEIPQQIHSDKSVLIHDYETMKDTADPQISGHINALIKKYAKAVNNRDAAALAALCTEEAVFVTPGGVVYGRQDIEKWHTDAFQRHPKDFSNPPDQHSPHMIGTTGDAVWSTGDWSEAFQGPNGNLIQVKGHWAAIIVREGGDWRLRMLTVNITPAPDPPAQTK
jgi:uncharacterized protein (TIGR02246 family)